MTDSNEFFKKLLAHLYDGVYFVDRQRRITYWSKGAERITGYQAEQVVGKLCSDNILNHCTEDGCELCLTACPLVHSLKTGQRPAHSIGQPPQPPSAIPLRFT